MMRTVVVAITAAGVVAGLVLAIRPPSIEALSTPTPNPPVTCPADLHLDALPEDSALTIQQLAGRAASPAFGSAFEDVNLTWLGLSLDAGCIAVFRDGDGRNQVSGSPYARLGPREDSWRDYALHASGDTCYRVVGVGEDRRGPTASVCVAVAAADHGPVSPSNFSRLAGVALVAVVLAPLGLLVRRWWMGRRDG